LFLKKIEDLWFSPGIFVSTKLEDWWFSAGIFFSTKLEDWWCSPGIFVSKKTRRFVVFTWYFLFLQN
jgi:hypothetical protein